MEPTSSDSSPVEEVQHCPKCGETTVKAATLTDRFVYLRCAACGEVWVIPERRQVRRSTLRQT